MTVPSFRSIGIKLQINDQGMLLNNYIYRLSTVTQIYNTEDKRLHHNLKFNKPEDRRLL